MKKSRQQKRVEIARDALKQIRFGRFKATTGSFFEGLSKVSMYDFSIDDDEEARTILQKGPFECHVCAKGALFVAHILRHDKVSKHEARLAGSEDVGVFMPYFSRKLLDEIEVLFEGRLFVWTFRRLSAKRIKQLLTYVAENNLLCLTPRERLIKVLRMLIRNKGEKVL